MNGSIPLTGYCDPLSVRPGESVSFQISNAVAETCQASLVQIVCADPNPAGPGLIEQNCDQWFEPRSLNTRVRPFYPGSCAVATSPISLDLQKDWSIQATIWPTLRKDRDQVILSVGPVALLLDSSMHLVLEISERRLESALSMDLGSWHQVRCGFDAQQQRLYLGRAEDDASLASFDSNIIDLPTPSRQDVTCCVAARWCDDQHQDHFNGKIEAPALYGTGADRPAGEGDAPVAAWDFSNSIPSDKVTALAGPALSLVNSPTRGVTGSAWDGSEMCWRHKPEHYGAIHFHEDDIYDFDWETDLEFVVPEGMPSGIYALRIESDTHSDSIPFFVCPPKSVPAAKLCVLIPTFTYVIYGNHARPDFAEEWLDRNDAWGAYPHNPAMHPEYGLSTYNNHSDGSGICHASHKRPLLNLRPGYLTFGNSDCSGLRHLQADSHLIAWLHNHNIDYDIITDRELHDEGMDAIEGYQAVMTTSHPEYHTRQTLDAISAYTASGGNLMYLGGNGFYWRIAIHTERPDLLEIRRAEDGIRAWAAEPGEYYNAFDGAYGGLWRRNGRPPQKICGVGFSAQGSFFGSYYRRKCFEPEFDWVFNGIDGERIGDFGLCGNGAAGFELDRVDYQLGSPKNLTVLASSEGHDDGFVLVPEEHLTHITNIPNEPVESLLRADMVYYELEGGGSVFSVGSITFCGSLPVDDFDNNVSTILGNIVAKMLN